MELRHLRYFVAVAEELHFGRAAERLAMSQPPLSTQIRDLERELGVSLLQRTSRRVALTEAGATFLDDARAILAAVDRAALAAARAGRGELGTVSVGFLGAAAVRRLPTAVRTFQADRPGVRVELREMTSSPSLLRALRGRLIDLALLRPPVTDDGVDQERLASEPFVAVVPRDHAFAGRTAVSVSELLAQPFVLWQRSVTPEVVDAMFGPTGLVGEPRNVVVESAGVQTVFGAVGAGLGVSMLPWSATAIQHPDVVVCQLEPPVPHIELVAVWRDEGLAPAGEALLAVLRAAWADEAARRDP